MALPRDYDAVFNRYRGEMPVEILRALARGESNFNPSLVHTAGSKARGLLQVTTVVLESYNKEHPGATLTADDMLDPDDNVRVACWHLNRLVAAYSASGYPDLVPNWSSPRWVLLFILGWNAGHSRAAGVQYMVAWLHGKHPWVDLPAPLWIVDLVIPDKQVLAPSAMATADLVIEYAAEAKAASTLRPPTGPAKLAWCKKVLGWYGAELGAVAPDSSTSGAGGFPWVLLLLLFVASRGKRKR